MSHFGHYFAVHRNGAGSDQHVSIAARADAGIGYILVQADGAVLFRKFEGEYFLFLRVLPSLASAFVDNFSQDVRVGCHITAARTSFLIRVFVKVSELAARTEIVLVLVALSPIGFAFLIPEITSRTETALFGVIVASEAWRVILLAIIPGRPKTPASLFGIERAVLFACRTETSAFVV